MCNCGEIDNVEIVNLLTHSAHGFVIDEYVETKPINYIDFESKIINHQTEFLNKIFPTPQDFETNFNYYFKIRENGKELKKNFHIFDDGEKTRLNIVYLFTETCNLGNKIYFFGASGKGKSITLIGALKYFISHELFGTFYINCKALEIAIQNQQFRIARKLLSDEILYLFCHNYDKYLKCLEIINSFNFTNNKGFWPLIDIILELCTDPNKKYIIGFDQYNDFTDKKNQLNYLEEKHLSKKKFKFIVISSMNETDIRQKKINFLFEKSKQKFVYELSTLCNTFDTNFNLYQLNAFDKLGRTFKAYNEILLISNEAEINEYIKEKRKKYLYNMISFYDRSLKKEKFNTKLTEEEIMNISEDNYIKFLSFKINYNYSEDEIRSIIENIPFKYFNIINNIDKYVIKTSFPLINDLLNDIFRYIILNKNFDAFKQLSNNKGSAYSSLFEYKVRYNFYPPIKGEIKYFKNFIINDAVQMKVIIPKENEKMSQNLYKN